MESNTIGNHMQPRHLIQKIHLKKYNIAAAQKNRSKIATR